MKKVILASLYFPFLYANSLPIVNYDPFYKSQKILHTRHASKRQSNSFVLSAIYNNRAFVNNRFYTVGEKIQGYKIKKIYKQSVVLQNRSRLKILHLQKNHLIQIKQAKREEK
ncbi:hypothetical protein [Sulfurimonas hydrogeniphila]|uniref:hypothetical protein n=1 Tax=Sulfurimonas hydrogeniphila TaxID=2509341 RepID=UPI00125ED208|nr:hypothetical protein [Sulfurimonas hydrogeniphila]